MNPGFRLEQGTILTAYCTMCGCSYGSSGDEVGVGFVSQHEAETALRADGWWLLTTGPMCDWCAVRQGCRDHGHLLAGWRPCHCFGASRAIPNK